MSNTNSENLLLKVFKICKNQIMLSSTRWYLMWNVCSMHVEYMQQNFTIFYLDLCILANNTQANVTILTGFLWIFSHSVLVELNFSLSYFWLLNAIFTKLFVRHWLKCSKTFGCRFLCDAVSCGMHVECNNSHYFFFIWRYLPT